MVSPSKKYRKAVRWCASLNRSLYWWIRLIWIGLLDLWVDWIGLNEWIQYIISIGLCPNIISRGWRFHEISHLKPNISWSHISWDIKQEPQYLMITDFERYYTRTQISHVWRFCEILHQNHNISWLQVSWDSTLLHF